MIKKRTKSGSQRAKFSPKQLKVIEALGDPDDARTQGEIARHLKIAQETISRWKKLPGFMEEVNKRLDSKKKYVRPALWKQMVRQALGKSHQDRKLILEALGDIKGKDKRGEKIDVRIDWGPESPGDVEKEEQKKDD